MLINALVYLYYSYNPNSLVKSLKNAKSINVNNKISPTFCPCNCICSDNGFPLHHSKKYINKCPPSSMGIGNKLRIPRLILIMAKKLKKARTPLSADAPANCAILIGPPKFLLDTSPASIPTKLFTVNADIFHVVSTALNSPENTL